MAGRHSLQLAGRAYFKKLESLLKTSKSFEALKNTLQGEKSTYIAQKSRLEEKTLDDTFIIELEKGVAAIEKITRNPRSFIKDEDVVVEAGRAKRISSRTVSHLASHTQFVHSVDEKGNVTPEKLLVPESDIDYWIYENRFLMTLINKASVFVEKRFLFVKDHGETRDSEVLLLHTLSEVSGVRFEVDTRVKVSALSKDGGQAEKNDRLLLRLAKLRERLAFLSSSPFMQLMRGAKSVANPIHPTNLLVKHPDYKKALRLWKFIDSYKELGISYSVSESNKKFKEDYVTKLMALLSESILTLEANLIEKDEIKPKKKKKKIVPKVIFSLEDETFYDGRFLYDQFPMEERERTTPMSPTEEEARQYREQFERKIKSDRAKRAIVEAEIERAKEKDVEEEAKARRREQEKRRQEEERQAAVRRLELERAKLEAEKKSLEGIRNREKEELEKLRLTRIEVFRLGRSDRGPLDMPSADSTPYPDQKPFERPGGLIMADDSGLPEGIAEEEDKPSIVEGIDIEEQGEAIPTFEVGIEKANENPNIEENKQEAIKETKTEEKESKPKAKQKKGASKAKKAPSKDKEKAEKSEKKRKTTKKTVKKEIDKEKENEVTKSIPLPLESDNEQKPIEAEKKEEKPVEPAPPSPAPKEEEKAAEPSKEETKAITPKRKKGKAARKAKKEEERAKKEEEERQTPHFTTLKTRSKRGGRSFVKDYAKNRRKG